MLLVSPSSRAIPAAGRKPGLLGQVRAETGQRLGADLVTVTGFPQRGCGGSAILRGSGHCRLCLLTANAIIKQVLCTSSVLRTVHVAPHLFFYHNS